MKGVVQLAERIRFDSGYCLKSSIVASLPNTL